MGYIDIHSHILPGMDDGSRSMGQTMRMLETAVNEGIAIMIATPHNMPGKGCPPGSVVRRKAAELRRTVEQEGIPIEIIPGTEYYYREEVPDLLDSGDAVTLGDSHCVLVEFEPLAERNYIRNALRNILGLGYTPVIAHAERYVKLMEDIAILYDMRKNGILVQVNAMSVTGDNGRQAKKDVRNLLKKGLVDFVATDAHSDGRRAPYMQKCADILYKKYSAEYANRLLFKNAEEILLS